MRYYLYYENDSVVGWNATEAPAYGVEVSLDAYITALAGIGIDCEGLRPAIAALTAAKLGENDAACRTRILSGFDSAAKGDELRHYSFSYEHQINMMGIESQIFMAAATAQESDIRWKNSAQDECEPWTAAEFNRLATEAKAFKTAKTVKHDALQARIKACTTAAELEAVSLDYETSA